MGQEGNGPGWTHSGRFSKRVSASQWNHCRICQCACRCRWLATRCFTVTVPDVACCSEEVDFLVDLRVPCLGRSRPLQELTGWVMGTDGWPSVDVVQYAGIRQRVAMGSSVVSVWSEYSGIGCPLCTGDQANWSARAFWWSVTGCVVSGNVRYANHLILRYSARTARSKLACFPTGLLGTNLRFRALQCLHGLTTHLEEGSEHVDDVGVHSHTL